MTVVPLYHLYSDTNNHLYRYIGLRAYRPMHNAEKFKQILSYNLLSYTYFLYHKIHRSFHSVLIKKHNLIKEPLYQ